MKRLICLYLSYFALTILKSGVNTPRSTRAGMFSPSCKMYSFLRLCEAVTAARAALDLAVHLYAPFVLRTYWRVSVSVQSVTERNRPSSSCSNVSSSAPRATLRCATFCPCWYSSWKKAFPRSVKGRTVTRECPIRATGSARTSLVSVSSRSERSETTMLMRRTSL